MQDACVIAPSALGTASTSTASTSTASRTQVTPKSLINRVDRFNGCLRVSDQRGQWFIYFDQGKITYASNCIGAFERLERHLGGLAVDYPDLTDEVKQRLRTEFEPSTSLNSDLTPDYEALIWLVEQAVIDSLMAGILASKITAEVLESYLLLPEANYQVEQVECFGLPNFCTLDPGTLVQRCQARLKLWQDLQPYIHSPYQRPYLVREAIARQKLSAEKVNLLGRLLIGFHFRQLAIVLKQDELAIAQQLSPLIAAGVIILRDPAEPFDRLPKFPAIPQPPSPVPSNLQASQSPNPQATQVALGSTLGKTALQLSEQKTWNILCIDDSPAILNEMQRILESDAFSLTLISDPKKALMKAISLEPDLILLDVTMPELDGYQICSMIRKSSLLKHIPIVMVTGNRGLIDRARAKLVGATDYLTKPFSQKSLLSILLRYLGR